MSKKTIKGSGGGGGGSPRTPVESQDSLRSRNTARILDLISEGEIEGIVGGNKGVYLDETPLENEDGTTNFQGIEVQTREGTQDQTYIPGYNTVENEFFVNVKIVKDVPVVRSIVNPAVDAVKVRIAVPQLTSQNTSNGDISGFSVNYTIELQSNGGGYVEVLDQTITGKTTSKYQRSHLIELTGDAPWDIRVTRVTADDASINQQSGIYFEALTHVINAKLRYPNSALVGIKIDSSQFSNVPQRAYKTRGIKVRIPDNATVNDVDGSLTYSGESWSGDFVVAWTTNPAWILYDLLISERFGLGSYLTEDQVDKWGLYTIGRYCDERVDNGFGDTEPRFSCGCLYLQEQTEAFTAIQNLTTIFRGMSYWATGSISVTQDSPSDPVAQFTQANVVDGRFTYMGSSGKVRHSVALVTYNDPDDFYRQKVEYVEDADAIRKIGYISTQVYAVGCTSRSQAHRLGKWIIYTEQNETETVTFRIGVEGSLIRPGQVFYVADKLRASKRRAGRIFSATTTQIVVDVALTEDVTGGQLSCIMPDGTMPALRTITGVVGKTISFTPAYAVAPQPNSIWGVASAELEPQTFRAISIVEAERGIFEITGLAYNASKFSSIENGTKLEPRNITSLNSQPSQPENLQISEYLYSASNIVKNKVIISWDNVSNATEYKVSYKVGDGNYIPLPTVYSNEAEVTDAPSGIYTFSVVAVNSLGRRSPISYKTKEIYGKLTLPVDVTGFSIIPNIANNAVLSWNIATDLDVLIGGQVRIRWTPASVANWKDSIDIIEALSGTTTTAQVPLLEGTYLAKFVDSSGNESENSATIYTTVPYGNALNAVHTETENSDFAGVKTNCEVSVDLGGLVISGNETIDDVPDIDLMDDIDFIGALFNTATYEFENTVDLGAVYPSRITARILVETFEIDDLIDSRLEDIDLWEAFDGGLISDVHAKLYMRTTEDNPSGSPTWTDWKPFFIGEYIARGFQFKLELETENVNHNIIIKEMSVVIDMPDRTDWSFNNASGAGTYNAVFNSPFWETPAIIISAYNMATGDYYEISSQTESGFSIVFRNAAGTAVNRTFDFVAKGYGREII